MELLRYSSYHMNYFLSPVLRYMTSFNVLLNMLCFNHFTLQRLPCYKDVPKLTQDLNLIENTVFSLDYIIFVLNYKVHRIGLFVE